MHPHVDQFLKPHLKGVLEVHSVFPYGADNQQRGRHAGIESFRHVDPTALVILTVFAGTLGY